MTVALCPACETATADCRCVDRSVLERPEDTHEIIGAAIEVHRALGPGLKEIMYTRALAIELRLRGLKASPEHRIEVTYKGRGLGPHYLDLVVETPGGLVVVECKSFPAVEVVHTRDARVVLAKAQLATYLRCAKVRRGLVIDFGGARLVDGVWSVLNERLGPSARREDHGGMVPPRPLSADGPNYVRKPTKEKTP